MDYNTLDYIITFCSFIKFNNKKGEINENYNNLYQFNVFGCWLCKQATVSWKKMFARQ